MSLSTLQAPSSVSLNIEDMIANADQVSRDIRNDAKITRQLTHQKNMAFVDKHIGKLKEQGNQVGKAGWFNFFIGLASNFVNALTQVLNLVLPGIGPAIAQIANQFVQGMLNAVGQINPHNKKASEAGIKAEAFKKDASHEGYLSQMEDERIKQMVESHQIFKNRMEKAMDHLQKAKETTVKV